MLGWCYPIQDEDDQPGMTEERLRSHLQAQRRERMNPEDTGGVESAAGSAQEDGDTVRIPVIADTGARFHTVPNRLIEDFRAAQLRARDARRRNLTPVAAVHASRSSTIRANIIARNPRYADMDVSLRANGVRRRVRGAVDGLMRISDMEEVD